MRRYIIGWILLLGISNCALAQPQQLIDSLALELEQAVDSFEKSNYAYQLSYAYMNTDPQQGLGYVKKAIHLLPKDSIRQLAQGYNMIGITYAQLYPDSLQVSIKYFEKAAQVFQQLNHIEQVGDAYANIAQAYILLQDYDKALQALYQSQKLYEFLQNHQQLSSIYDRLVSINLKQRDYKEGLKNAHKHLEITLQRNSIDSSLKTKQPQLRALAEYNVGLCYLKMRNLDSAEYYLLEALEDFEQLEYNNHIVNTATSLADTYIFKEELKKAQQYLTKALELEDAFRTTKQKLNTKNTLANLYHKLGEYKKSITIHEQVLKTAQEQNFLEMELMTLKALSESYYQLGKSQKAYELLQAALPLQDSIINKDRDQAIEDLEIKYATQYESEKKEQENVLLSQQLDIQTLRAANREQLIYGILGLLCLVIIIFVLIVRQNKIETTRRMQQLNYRLLLNQMSPHFIFNALTAIQSFVYRNEPRKAGKYLSSFAKLMRAILENSRTEYISLAKELQWLDNYLRLQALRFNNKFEYEVVVAEELEVEAVLLPPMLTQPFIENAIEHGIKDMESKGLLTIQFRIEEEQLVVHIEDNGVGFEEAQPQKSDHISLATKITKERLNFLNQGNTNKIDFTISSVPNVGTAVSFSIPVQYS